MHGQGAAMLGLHEEAWVASAGADPPWLLTIACISCSIGLRCAAS
jgi:hypothetical protein